MMCGFFILLQINHIFKYLIMKTRKIYTFLFLLMLLPSFIASAQKTDISGEWKLNKEKATIADNQLFLSKISIQLKADSIMTTRVYENGMGEEYPFDEKLSLDGKECKIVIYDMPRISTASRSSDGTITIASATTFYGNNGQEDMVAKETWKVDKEGKMLTLEFSNKMSGTESTGTYFYDKAN
jgi:hypothetical protein